MICVSLSFVYYIAAARYFGIDSYGHSYEVSAYVQPLSQIFHDKKTSILSESEIADIDAVLDTKMLSDKFNPLDIDPYHSGAFKQSATEIQWVKFKKVSLKLIFNNLDLFFQSRIYLFKNMLNIGLSHLVFSDDVTVNQFERNSIWLTKLGIDRSSLKRSSAAVAYVDFLYFSTASQNLLAAAVSTFVLPLLLVLGCLLLFSSIPSLFTLAVIFSLRLPILFLLAPASYIQYIYSIFLFFTFVPVLLFLHYFERKKT